MNFVSLNCCCRRRRMHSNSANCFSTLPALNTSNARTSARAKVFCATVSARVYGVSVRDDASRDVVGGWRVLGRTRPKLTEWVITCLVCWLLHMGTWYSVNFVVVGFDCWIVRGAFSLFDWIIINYCHLCTDRIWPKTKNTAMGKSVCTTQQTTDKNIVQKYSHLCAHRLCNGCITKPKLSFSHCAVFVCERAESAACRCRYTSIF